MTLVLGLVEQVLLQCLLVAVHQISVTLAVLPLRWELAVGHQRLSTLELRQWKLVADHREAARQVVQRQEQ